MTTRYVNINNAYTTTGDGTINNQYNWDQMILIGNAANFTGNTVLLQGYRTLTTGSPIRPFPWTGFIVNAQNITQPWKIKSTGQDIFLGGSYGCSIKNGMINVNGAYLQPGRESEVYGNLTYDNMVLKGTGSPMQFSPDNGTLRFNGCTIESDIALNLRGFTGNTIVFENCIFKVLNPTNWGYSNPNNVQTTFRNCVSTVNLDSVINSTRIGCQNNWTPATLLPTTDSIQSDFLEQTVAPDISGNDITITSYTTGSFSGYEAGLFGGKLRTSSHGIGALYFGPVLSYTSRPSSVIPSSKKFIYQPVVDGDTITSWEITTMPSGMTFSTSTGRVEWIPLSGVTTSGSLTLTAHSTSNGDLTQTFTLAVDTAPRITSTAPDLATNGSLFNYQPVVVDAENNVSGSAYSLVGFPVGMTISATTGLISWTPSATGTFHFTLKVVDSNGLFDAQLVTLTVS